MKKIELNFVKIIQEGERRNKSPREILRELKDYAKVESERITAEFEKRKNAN